MTERERLIELMTKSENENLNLLEFEKKILADYLLANGVIVPPCKVGDPAYMIYSDKDLGSYIDEFKITDVSTCQGWMDSIWVFDYEKIGKTVFLTREEAEQALKEKESTENA